MYYIKLSDIQTKLNNVTIGIDKRVISANKIKDNTNMLYILLLDLII